LLNVNKPVQQIESVLNGLVASLRLPLVLVANLFWIAEGLAAPGDHRVSGSNWYVATKGAADPSKAMPDQRVTLDGGLTLLPPSS
jgi:hypothetical protein